MPRVWAFARGNHADHSVSVLLRVRQLRHSAAPQARGLLRLLLVWQRPVPADPTRWALLRYVKSPTSATGRSSTFLGRGATLHVRHPSDRLSPMRRLLQSRDIALCSPASCGLTEAGQL